MFHKSCQLLLSTFTSKPLTILNTLKNQYIKIFSYDCSYTERTKHNVQTMDFFLSLCRIISVSANEEVTDNNAVHL